MVPKIIENNWSKLLNINESFFLYDFIDIFSVVVEPYTNKNKLQPSDRLNIFNELKESLCIECQISEECNSENIRDFCYRIAFEILDSCKNSPDQLLTTISSLKTKK